MALLPDGDTRSSMVRDTRQQSDITSSTAQQMDEAPQRDDFAKRN